MSLFDDERKRNINLGGSSTAAAQSQSALFDQVRQRRELRLEQKRRNDAAIRIQSQWRGTLSKQRLRVELRRTFDGDVTGLTGMRCLVLLGQDDEALGMWCSTMAAADWTGAMTTSWVVLARQLSLRLLTAVATKTSPMFPSSSHLPLLHSLYCPPLAPSSLNPRVIYSTHHIVTLSILTYRIPLTSRTQLGARFPFAHLLVVHLTRPLSVEARVNSVANLLALDPAARHAQLKSALPAYIRILSDVMESLPLGVFDPEAHHPGCRGNRNDGSYITVTVVPYFRSAALPHFESRTVKRLKTLPSVPHLTSLITHAKKELVRFFLALTGVWRLEKERAVDIFGMDPRDLSNSAEEWPSMLLLADVYTDLMSRRCRVFCHGNSRTRNPLNRDEVMQQLLNIHGGRTAASDVCPGLRVSWDTARDKVTNCLVAIRTREYATRFSPLFSKLISFCSTRKSFMPY
ncbi:hypothetical protein BDZ89DRAFT_1103514, partial [Hymenopellis radicata]